MAGVSPVRLRGIAQQAYGRQRPVEDVYMAVYICYRRTDLPDELFEFYPIIRRSRKTGADEGDELCFLIERAKKLEGR